MVVLLHYTLGKGESAAGINFTSNILPLALDPEVWVCEMATAGVSSGEPKSSEKKLKALVGVACQRNISIFNHLAPRFGFLMAHKGKSFKSTHRRAFRWVIWENPWTASRRLSPDGMGHLLDDPE